MKPDRREEPRKGPFADPLATVYERRALVMEDRPLPDYNERIPMSKTLASYWRFLLAGLINGVQTGAVIPSQRVLISKMIAPVPVDYDGQIIELGAGTGALTLHLAARCPKARVLACEINPVLARDIEERLQSSGLEGRVQVISDSAEHLLASLRRQGAQCPDFVISGIPLGNLDRESVLALIQSIHRSLAARGMYIQFQHSIIDRKKIKENFSRLRTVPVFLNFPPAVIYYALK
jgi:phosphatidylethanolamine/phosphatidyl-N-methylethanolamine N-methyltransferase